MIKIFSLIIPFLFFSLETTSNDFDSLECREGNPEVFFITPNQNLVTSTGVINLESVSYTHLTLPTNSGV